MRKRLIQWSVLSLCVCALVFTHDAEAAKIEKMDKKELQSLSEAEVEKQLQLLEERVLEIQAMDLSSMERPERREIKKELREIKKQNDFLSGGVYLSVGAIIIILLVLILLT